MSLSTVLWIIGVFFGLIIISLIFILVYNFGKKRARNNRDKALVLVKDGNDIMVYKGMMTNKSCKSGTQYSYADRMVIVPSKYSEVYVKGARLIVVNRLGQLIASPFAEKIDFEQDERENIIYEVVESKIGGEVIKSIKGSSGGNIILVCIIAFIVGVGVMFGFTKIQETYSQQQKPPITQQQQQTTDNTTLNQNNAVRIEK